MTIARVITGLALAAGLVVVPVGGRAQVVATAPVEVSDWVPMGDNPIVIGGGAPGFSVPVIEGGVVLDPGVGGPIVPFGSAATRDDSNVRRRAPGDLLWKTLHDRGWEALRGFVPNDEEKAKRLDVADSLFRAALERLQPYGAGDDRVATTYTDLAWVFLLREQYDEARSLASWALDDRINRLGPLSPRSGDSLLLMARIAAAQDRFAEAEGFAKRALASFTRSSPVPLADLHTPIALDVLGQVHAEQGRLDLAEAYVRRAFDWRQSIFDDEMYPPDRHIQVVVELARSNVTLAALLRKLDRTEEAEILEDQARYLLESAVGAPSEPMAPAPVPGV